MENRPIAVKNRIAKYLDYEVEVGNDETPEQVKTNLSEIFPEISHAKYTQHPDGTIEFEVTAGTKG
ncbi:MAG: hypothetical protein A2536_09460 [Candidatus Firestonebacteria bacterium RIFOXYD2_FULL_39_29]|nr:MAG: hypothetical protein A2536_09460 [Candidatus Firestonebacteria bacterium RIFOXYD2_FULL_39_29]